MRDDAITLHDGRRMAYIECGDAGDVPVLCCHGAPGSRLGFAGCDQLAGDLGVRLIAPDRPGYGGSDPRPGRRIEDWPADLLELTARLGIDRFAVVGISSGAPYALAAAAREGRHVFAVGLLAGVGDMGRKGAEDGFLASEAALMQLARSDPAAVLAEVDAYAATVQADPAAALAAFGAPASARQTASFTEAFRQGGAGYAEDVIAQARPWSFDPREVSAPVFIWHGDEDEMAPLHHARHTASLLRRATLHVIPGEGHMQVASRLAGLLPLLLGARR